MDFGDFAFDAVFVEQRLLAVVQLQPADIPRHDDLQELLGPFVGGRLVDEDRIDFAGEDIADGADDHVAFFVDRDRRRRFFDAPRDHFPQPQQIRQIARDFFLGAIDAGGADDEAQAARRIQFVHDVAQLAAGFFIFDFSRDARRGPAPASAPDSGREC